MTKKCTILTVNLVIFLHFGGTSGEFGLAMVCILTRPKRATIPMARPDESGIYRTQIWPSEDDWLIENSGTVNI